MCVWDENSGRITLGDAFSLRSNMARKNVQEGLETLTGKPCGLDDPQHATMLSACALSFQGMRTACVCSLSHGRLRSVALYPAEGTAAQQRAALFRFIGRQDPCPDTMRSVRIRGPFGTAWIATDFHSGDASLRITYAVKE